MAYRDDVEAVYERASALQREVDRLQAELVEARAPRPPAAKPRTGMQVPPHLRERTPPVWLPPTTMGVKEYRASLARLDELAEPAAGAEPGPALTDHEPIEAFDPEPAPLGLLVARLSLSEHDLVRRLLEVLTEDDFSSDGVRRNLRALEIIAAELRVQLGVPR